MNCIVFFLVSDTEYRRLCDGFKRVVAHNSYMSKAAFFKEVLGDSFPTSIADVRITFRTNKLIQSTILYLVTKIVCCLCSPCTTHVVAAQRESYSKI